MAVAVATGITVQLELQGRFTRNAIVTFTALYVNVLIPLFGIRCGR